ncbi:gluconokinase [Geomicrobium halophilum]|uniref:Gluconokinase n=1 Tax=Geomicrobium halophilum TaxID=549000 RepID=A0A841PMW8_9BACL|nr:FGGY family carbohydrate kinase [Geomicrobium halophilum]MBB6448556.1 gluconokinase [Geomicrobium halophilum]
MNERLYMGVDIGTSGVKAIAFDQDGNEQFKAHETYPLETPTPDTAVQDPELIYEKTRAVIMEVAEHCENKVACVSFSSAMHSLVCMNESGALLTPLITWADKRSAHVSKRWQADGTGHTLYEKTGTPTHPMSPLCKLRWLQEEQPQLLENTAMAFGIKEYIFFRLFDVTVMDESLASATGLMNIHSLEWDETALQAAGLFPSQLPDLVKTTAAFHSKDQKQRDSLRSLNLSPDTPFVIGASDGVLSNLGVGAINHGEVALTIGTSAAVRSASRTPHIDDKGRTFCYLLTEDHWIIGGAVNNGGLVLQWLVEEFVKEQHQSIGLAEATNTVMHDTKDVPPGANGLFFLPFLTGERAPLWNPDARAAFLGLSIAHTREDMVRAALEGVTYNIYSVLLALQELIGVPQAVYASGGFSRSSSWKQIVADVFDQPLYFPTSYESSTFGAAVLAMYALEDIQDLHHFKNQQLIEEKIEPNTENVKTYQELMSVYLDLSRSLAPHYERLTEMQQRLNGESRKNPVHPRT